MDFTYYGHSCFTVGIKVKKLLFDPFIKPNEWAKQINADAIPADFILLSHGHADRRNDFNIKSKIEEQMVPWQK